MEVPPFPTYHLAVIFPGHCKTPHQTTPKTRSHLLRLSVGQAGLHAQSREFCVPELVTVRERKPYGRLVSYSHWCSAHHVPSNTESLLPVILGLQLQHQTPQEGHCWEKKRIIFCDKQVLNENRKKGTFTAAKTYKLQTINSQWINKFMCQSYDRFKPITIPCKIKYTKLSKHNGKSTCWTSRLPAVKSTWHWYALMGYLSCPGQ